ncbi:MAG: GGDEF domain-containing protein [Proteobacteria bacterium]|nr:GGDEF domain-containing protein [Pseudomonadota bacterium]
MAPRPRPEDFADTTLALMPGDEEDSELIQVRDRAYVMMLAGSQVGQMFKIEGEMVIGRDPRCTVPITDDGISRQHVRLSEGPHGQIMITDLGSRNGTLVNGERVQSMALKDGDRIHIGSTTILKFSYADHLDETFQQKMYDAAVRDPLTRVHNRRFMFERLATEFRFSSRHGSPLALTVFDLDHFKRVNDTHGHGTGDAVLVAFAERLTAAVRDEDLVVRYGGEEFVLICRGLNSEIARVVANRIREQIRALRLIPALSELIVTVSGGVASIPHPRIATVEQLLAAADEALYAAKQAGRDGVCVFGERGSDPGER